MQTDVESDTEEDEFELEGEASSDVEFYEDRRVSEDLEELSDPHSSKFRAEGQLMNFEEDPSFEGYLLVKVRIIDSNCTVNCTVINVLLRDMPKDECHY